MARYQVPQFIEVEDKIFGPLTLKQFLYVAGGGALGFIIYTIIPGFFGIILALPVVAFFLAMAFYKVNGRPFVNTAENAIKYFVGSKLYIWREKEKTPQAQSPEKKPDTDDQLDQLFVPRLSDSKLKQLSWGLDINETLADIPKDNGNLKI